MYENIFHFMITGIYNIKEGNRFTWIINCINTCRLNCNLLGPVDVIQAVTSMDYRTFRQKIIHNDYGTKENVLEIYRYLEKLQIDISNLQINVQGTSYGWRDWEKKQNIVREMKFCADLMEEMFGETNHGEALQYREWYELYFLTFSIGKHICEMVCKLCVHVTFRLSSSHMDLCESIGKIPHAFSEVLQSLKLTTAKVLSNNTNPFMAETIEYNFCRIQLNFEISNTDISNAMNMSKSQPLIVFTYFTRDISIF